MSCVSIYRNNIAVILSLHPVYLSDPLSNACPLETSSYAEVSEFEFTNSPLAKLLFFPNNIKWDSIRSKIDTGRSP